MKILIISSFFPPQNSIASLRPYSWAKYWSRAGHDVTVLTVPKKTTSVDLNMPLDGFHVIEAPIPGFEWLSKKIGGNDNKNSQNDKITVPKKSHVSQFKKIFRRSLLIIQSKYGIASACRMPDPLDFWCKSALEKLGGQTWDLVVSTSGPYGVHAPAYFLRKNGLAKRWIADWRDLWTDNHIYHGLPVFRTIERFLEKRWCNTADAITTVSEPTASVMRKKYGEKVNVIYNGFDPDDYKNISPENAFPDDGVLRIVYTGSVYPGYQDPTPLFKAIHALDTLNSIKPDTLQVLFCGANTNLQDKAINEGVEDYIQCLGIIPRDKALQIQRDASILLFLEFESNSAKGILPGKLFEYLSATAPVWGIGIGGDSSASNIFHQTGRGINFGTNVNRIASEILKELENKYHSKNNKERNNEQINIYLRSTQAFNLLNC